MRGWVRVRVRKLCVKLEAGCTHEHTEKIEAGCTHEDRKKREAGCTHEHTEKLGVGFTHEHASRVLLFGLWCVPCVNASP